MPFQFGPEARLSDRKDFGRVFSAGRKIVGKSLIIWRLETRSNRPPRLGLSMSTKVGNSVRRNRLKRLTRETFRLNNSRLKKGLDLVVYFRQGCPWKGQADAQNEIFGLWERGGMLA